MVLLYVELVNLLVGAGDWMEIKGTVFHQKSTGEKPFFCLHPIVPLVLRILSMACAAPLNDKMLARR